MNPYKPGHQIVCAHCAAADAADECEGCHRPVCPACVADPSGCRKPRAISMQLGRGFRVKAIDRHGERVALTRWHGWAAPVLRELRSGKRIAVSNLGLTSRRHALVGIDSSGELVAQPSTGSRTCTLCSCGSHVVRVYSDETINIHPVGAAPGGKQETLRGRVIEAVSYDCASGQLLLGTRNLVALFSVDDEQRIGRRIGRIVVTDPLIEWMELRAGCATLITAEWMTIGDKLSRSYHIRAYRTHAEGIQNLPFFERADGHQRDWGPAFASVTSQSTDAPLVVGFCAALRADGVVLALSLANGAVAAVDLETGAIETFEEHRKAPLFVGFTDKHLASADPTGHLVLRERDGDRYSSWLTLAA